MASELDRFASSHQCRFCKTDSTLVVRWRGDLGEHQVACGKCGETKLFESRKSTTQRWRENPANVDIATANRLEEKYGGNPMTERALATIDEKTMMVRLEEARWTKDLTLPDRKALAGLSVMYHLDPVMSELILYEGKPYITLNGHLRLANQHPQWAGVTDRPMTKDEREAYGITAPIACLAEVYRKGMAVPAKGIGTADPAKPLRNNPLERDHPYRQARARAIRMALRTYFPHGLPLGEAEDRGIVVDTDTGEIIADPALTSITVETPPEANPFEVTAEAQEQAGPTWTEAEWQAAEAKVVDACKSRHFNIEVVKAQAMQHYADDWAKLPPSALEAVATSVLKAEARKAVAS